MALADFSLFHSDLESLDGSQGLITTINAHSYNLAKTDDAFRQALLESDVLIPDGVSIVLAARWLSGLRLRKIAGADLFYYEMSRLQATRGRCFFLGSTPETLDKIVARAAVEYPDVQIETYSPPYKSEFSAEDDSAMIEAINKFTPDVLFVGMTAPKQEKWAVKHIGKLPDIGHVCCIGAVFDFYAGTVNRAPQWMIRMGLEWLYRLLREPRRMWRRYLIGNAKFLIGIMSEKIASLRKRASQDKR